MTEMKNRRDGKQWRICNHQVILVLHWKYNEEEEEGKGEANVEPEVIVEAQKKTETMMVFTWSAHYYSTCGCPSQTRYCVKIHITS